MSVCYCCNFIVFIIGSRSQFPCPIWMFHSSSFYSFHYHLIRGFFFRWLYKIASVPTLNTPLSPHLSLFLFIIFITTRHISLLFVFSHQNVSSLRAGASCICLLLHTQLLEQFLHIVNVIQCWLKIVNSVEVKLNSVTLFIRLHLTFPLSPVLPTIGCSSQYSCPLNWHLG